MHLKWKAWAFGSADANHCDGTGRFPLNWTRSLLIRAGPGLGPWLVQQGVSAVNKVSSSLVIVSTLVVAFVISVVFYLALSPERNGHTGPGAPPPQSTGLR